MPAQRDMSARQFADALKRYGIERYALWYIRPDLPNVHIGAVLHPKKRGIHRRETLARVLNYKDRRK